MSIGSVAEFFLGNKQEPHKTDVSLQAELDNPQVMPQVFPATQNPNGRRVMMNEYAKRVNEAKKAA